jgi:hypothetical protein
MMPRAQYCWIRADGAQNARCFITLCRFLDRKVRGSARRRVQAHWGVGQGDEHLHCGRNGQDRSGSEGSKRTSSVLKNPAYHFKRIGLDPGNQRAIRLFALG